MRKYKATYTQFEKPNEIEIFTTLLPNIDAMKLAILNKNKKRETEHPSTSSEVLSEEDILQRLKDIGVDPESITVL